MLSSSSLVVAAVVLSGAVGAQTPPSYSQAKTNKTLGVKYGDVVVRAGETLGFHVPAHAPTLSTTPSLPLNTSYIAILVDPTANLSAPIPADLFWFQQDLVPGPSGSGILTTNTTAQVPYLAPSIPDHAYLALLYPQPPDFIIPPNFPYKAGFRTGFNVSRVAVDFRTPLLAANWFVLGSNCTKMEEKKHLGYRGRGAGRFVGKGDFE